MSFFARAVLLLLLVSAAISALSRADSARPVSWTEFEAAAGGRASGEAGDFLLAPREEPTAIEVIAALPRRQRELLERDNDIAWSIASACLRSRATAISAGSSEISDTAAAYTVTKSWAVTRTAMGRQTDP